MIKDFLRRREIDARAKEIVEEIVASYPPQFDAEKNSGAGGKVSRRKTNKKLVRALQNSTKQIADINKKMKLGIYGKARLYKTIQTGLSGLNYTDNTTRFFVEWFTRIV